MRRMMVLRAGAAFVIAAGLALSAWQFWRADQKRQLEAQAQSALTAAAININAAPEDEDETLPLFHRARARGEFLADKTILLDNRLHNRRAGYFVITPLVLADGAALAVNRGWIAGGKTRNPPPDAPPPPSGEVIIDGYLAADEVGALILSGQNRDDDNPMVWQRLILNEYEDYAGVAMMNRVLVSSGDDSLIPPPPARIDYRSARSVGYAFQWLSLALVAAVFYIVLSRREKRQQQAGDKRGDNNA